jgi:hypothetical protein
MIYVYFYKRSYCVLTLILKSSYDFIFVFITIAILPLLCEDETSVYPYSVNSG